MECFGRCVRALMRGFRLGQKELEISHGAYIWMVLSSLKRLRSTLNRPSFRYSSRVNAWIQLDATYAFRFFAGLLTALSSSIL